MNRFLLKGKCSFECVTAVLLALLLFVSNLGFINVPTSVSQLVGIIIVFIFFIIYRDDKERKQRIFDKIVFFLLGGLFLVNGIVYKTPTYILYAIIFIVQLPCILDKISVNTMKKFYKSFFFCIFILAIISIILSLIYAPLDERLGYSGIFGNQNLFGEFISYSFIGTVYMLETSKNKKITIVANIILGSLLAFVFYSRSRTTLLSSIVILAIYSIYIIINNKEKFSKIFRLIIATICMFFIIFSVLNYVRPVIINVSYKIINSNSIETINKSSLEKQMKATYERYEKGIENDGDISSGRFEIWNEYIKNIDVVRGHSGKDIEIPGYYADKEYYANAHSTFIQLGYQIGVIGLIAFVLQFIAICVLCVKKLIFCKKVEISIWTLILWMIVANAFIRMVLSSVFSPYCSFSMFLYWIVAIPMYYMNGRKDI